MFREKNPELLPESLNLNGDFFELLLTELDEKWPWRATERQRTKTKQNSRTSR